MRRCKAAAVLLLALTIAVSGALPAAAGPVTGSAGLDMAAGVSHETGAMALNGRLNVAEAAAAGRRTSPRLTAGDLEYEVCGSSAEITRYTGTGGAVVIPETLDGCSVTSIGAGAFTDCRSLTDIELPAGINSVERLAFAGCSGLKQMTVSSTLVEVAGTAFEDVSLDVLRYHGSCAEYGTQANQFRDALNPQPKRIIFDDDEAPEPSDPGTEPSGNPPDPAVSGTLTGSPSPEDRLLVSPGVSVPELRAAYVPAEGGLEGLQFFWQVGESAPAAALVASQQATSVLSPEALSTLPVGESHVFCHAERDGRQLCAPLIWTVQVTGASGTLTAVPSTETEIILEQGSADGPSLTAAYTAATGGTDGLECRWSDGSSSVPLQYTQSGAGGRSVLSPAYLAALPLGAHRITCTPFVSGLQAGPAVLWMVEITDAENQPAGLSGSPAAAEQVAISKLLPPEAATSLEATFTAGTGIYQTGAAHSALFHWTVDGFPADSTQVGFSGSTSVLAGAYLCTLENGLHTVRCAVETGSEADSSLATHSLTWHVLVTSGSSYSEYRLGVRGLPTVGRLRCGQWLWLYAGQGRGGRRWPAGTQYTWRVLSGSGSCSAGRGAFTRFMSNAVGRNVVELIAGDADGNILDALTFELYIYDSGDGSTPPGPSASSGSTPGPSASSGSTPPGPDVSAGSSPRPTAGSSSQPSADYPTAVYRQVSDVHAGVPVTVRADLAGWEQEPVLSWGCIGGGISDAVGTNLSLDFQTASATFLPVETGPMEVFLLVQDDRFVCSVELSLTVLAEGQTLPPSPGPSVSPVPSAVPSSPSPSPPASESPAAPSLQPEPSRTASPSPSSSMPSPSSGTAGPSAAEPSGGVSGPPSTGPSWPIRPRPSAPDQIEVVMKPGVSYPCLLGLPISTRQKNYPAVSIGSYVEVSAGDSLLVCTVNGKPIEPDDRTVPFSTGQSLRVLHSGQIIMQTTVVVAGDVLGTGQLSIAQLVRIAQACTGSRPLSGAYLYAGDLSGSGRIDIGDVVREAQMIAGRAG